MARCFIIAPKAFGATFCHHTAERAIHPPNLPRRSARSTGGLLWDNRSGFATMPVMERPRASPRICAVCGEPLNAKGDCVSCLLRAGLEEGTEEDVAATPRQSDAATEHVFGDFEIARRTDGSLWELGRGAMGVTYRAVDKVLHRNVALKVIETPSAKGGSQAVRERFLREARAAAALRHPNVAGVFHLSASPNVERCYFAMELIEGKDLRTVMAQAVSRDAIVHPIAQRAGHDDQCARKRPGKRQPARDPQRRR